MLPTPHRVAVLAFDGVVAFDLATPCHVFAAAGGGRYAVAVCGPRPGEPVATSRPTAASSSPAAAARSAVAAAPSAAAPSAAAPSAAAPSAAAPSAAAPHAVAVPPSAAAATAPPAVAAPPAAAAPPIAAPWAVVADWPAAPFAVVPVAGLDAVAAADTVVVPGVGDEDAAPDPAVLEALRAAAARGARVASICTGAFVLAAAGLLDGRRATTHWAHAGDLARRFPGVAVEPDVLYVDEGDVCTSAGVAAGLDLCLHLVRRDHGARVANAVARRMVVPPHRDGGQAQYVDRPVAAAPAAGLAATRAWMSERLAEPLTVEAMAAHASVSPRTFARRFVAETGTTPLRWLLAERVAAARRLLEDTDADVEAVAARSGFGTAAGLREHFRRACGTTPTAYRATFRGISRREMAAGATTTRL